MAIVSVKNSLTSKNFICTNQAAASSTSTTISSNANTSDKFESNNKNSNITFNGKLQKDEVKAITVCSLGCFGLLVGDLLGSNAIKAASAFVSMLSMGYLCMKGLIGW